MIKRGLIFFCIAAAYYVGYAQSYAFRHLTTAEGLHSDLRLVFTEDRQGRLWIGSDEGISIFDGYQLSSFTPPDSALANTHNVQQIYCDKRGTIWIATPSGIRYKDENDSRFRRLESGAIPFSDAPFFSQADDSTLLIASRNNCYLVKKDRQVVKLDGLEKYYKQYKTLYCFQHFKGDEWLMGFRDKLLLVNVKQQALIKELPVLYVWCAAKVNDSTILAGSFARDTVWLVNVRNGNMEGVNNWPASNSEAMVGYPGSIEPIGNQKFAMASRYYGVCILDLAKRNIQVLDHDPSNPSSLKANGCRRLYISRTGTMFVASRGISYTPLHTTQFNGQKYLINKAGEKYDAGFTSMVQDRKKNFWIGTNTHLALWDRQTNTSVYYPFYDLKRGPQKFKTVRTVVTDKLDRKWVGTFGGGMGLLMPDGHYEQYRPDTADEEHSLPNVDVHSITKDRDENFIICTNAGFAFFDPVAKKMQTFFNHPKLKPIARKQTFYALADKKNNWWLAQSDGLFYYDRLADSLHPIKIAGGFLIRQVQVLATDSTGMVYAGGLEGLYIISPASLSVQKILGKKDGLASNNIVGLLCDKSGMMWILGNIGAARYEPKTGLLQSFDARDGMEQSNHTLCNFYLAADGEVFLTSSEGFNYFYPDKIKSDKKPLGVFVTAMELKDSLISMPKQVEHSFEYYQNNISFSYLAVDFRLGTSIQYRYNLKGFDTSFVYAGNQRIARYTNLPAGSYTFIVEASINGKDWYATPEPVRFKISKAFWKTWFFIFLMLLLLAAAILCFFLFRVKKVRREEAIKRDFESKIAQVRMNLLRTQMNPHFLFNSLNSINSFILKNDRQNASGYLTKFSRLMRLILDNSRNEWVSLENELKLIELYIQLEALRFNHSFEFSINTDSAIDAENILLPPMLIQPYIENAIWHGLMYRKEQGGFLAVNLTQHNGTLAIQIKDNGVGRAAAGALKSKSALQQKSYGMKITAERMSIVNETYHINAKAAVKDLVDETGNSMGTEVMLTLDKIVDRK
ncbi:MAG: histidine kinase [Bacteroidota bacterium]